jgi:hypothetical protein
MLGIVTSVALADRATPEFVMPVQEIGRFSVAIDSAAATPRTVSLPACGRARAQADRVWPRSAADLDLCLAAGVGPADQSPPARFARNIAQSARDLSRARQQQRGLREVWARFFTRYDILLWPAMRTTAIAHDHNPTSTRE